MAPSIAHRPRPSRKRGGGSRYPVCRAVPCEPAHMPQIFGRRTAAARMRAPTSRSRGCREDQRTALRAAAHPIRSCPGPFGWFRLSSPDLIQSDPVRACIRPERDSVRINQALIRHSRESGNPRLPPDRDWGQELQRLLWVPAFAGTFTLSPLNYRASTSSIASRLGPSIMTARVSPSG
jgi:hypothetical protein